jgi:hypothetical protein
MDGSESQWFREERRTERMAAEGMEIAGGFGPVERVHYQRHCSEAREGFP